MKRFVTALIGLAATLSSAAAEEAAGDPVPPASDTHAAFLARADRQFDRLDANHDGVVTKEEVDRAADQIAKTVRERIERQFSRADADKDGKETRAEYRDVADKRFARLDRTPEGQAIVKRMLEGRRATASTTPD